MADTDSEGASIPKVQELGVHKMEERILGGKGATGQDVSIILVPSGGTKDHKLACIRLHSHVLSTHSKYFNTCLSERWNGPTSPCKSSPVEFVLEAQAGVESYINCFSSMYSPLKSFESVEQALEILKVASQIDFQELMERISLYLSCTHWSKEDEVRVREYAASPDFPRSHLKDLVAHLGMDASKEQVCDSIRECTGVVFKAWCCQEQTLFPEYLKGIGHGPSSEFSRMVIGVVTDEAKKMFVNIANEWNGKSYEKDTSIETRNKLRAMKWILELLLDEGVAEELVRGIVHLDVVPRYASGYYHRFQDCIDVPDLSKVVLRIYKEVVAGRLLLKSPERFALFANWHYKTSFTLVIRKEFDEAAAKLFMTLSLEEQVELVKSRGELVHSCMGKLSLVTMVSKLPLYQSFE